MYPQVGPDVLKMPSSGPTSFSIIDWEFKLINFFKLILKEINRRAGCFNQELISSHCVKNVLRKSPYSVQIRGNTNQKKLLHWILFTQCLSAPARSHLLNQFFLFRDPLRHQMILASVFALIL